MNNHKLRRYYLEKDYNCAETILRAANEEYHLGLNEDSFRLVSGFGGGMGCGGTCGALSSAMAVISMFLVEERAHATEGFKEKCANFCQTFERELGSTKCSVPVSYT
uniref:C-GCAxxG-C-C family (seleno)protein n=1 Tax=Clostridium perfringens TaxID=1502 RepID=UPI0032190515